MNNSFTYSGNTFELPFPPMQDKKENKAIGSSLARLSDGSRVGYRYSSKNKNTFSLTFAPLTKGDVANLINYLDSIVGGKGVTFDWIDTYGVTTAVKLISPIASGYVTNNRFYAQLTLEDA